MSPVRNSFREVADPERARRFQELAVTLRLSGLHRTDIFSLGVVLYELTTAQKPFKGANFAEVVDNIVHSQPAAMARLNYDVPPELERITLKCLQKLPERRYQTARELMVDLRNLARELELGPSTSRLPKFSRSEALTSYAEDRVGTAAEP